jgi:site-specific recombinase XerD
MARAKIIYDSQYGGYKVQDENGKRHALGKCERQSKIPDEVVSKATPWFLVPKTENPISVAKNEKVETKNELADFLRLYPSHREAEVRESSLNNIRNVVKIFAKFVASRGLRRLDEITHIHISDWLDDLDCQVISKQSYIRVLSGVFNFAVDRHLIKGNPVSYASSRVAKMVAAYEANQPVRIVKHYNDAQKEQLRTALDKGVAENLVHPDIRDLIILMMFTGLRKRAAVNLSFEDIDGTIVNVPRPYDKGKKGYSAFLFPQAREVIERRREVLKSGKIFPDVKAKSMWTRIMHALKRIGLYDLVEMGHFNHILRHTHAMKLTDSGVSIQVVAEQLGHSSLRSTMIYARPNTDTLKATLGKVSM